AHHSVLRIPARSPTPDLHDQFARERARPAPQDHQDARPFPYRRRRDEIDLARAAQHHGQVGAHRVLLAAGDESIRDSLRRPLFAVERVKCTSAWTLPEPWTHRTRPPLLGKPHRTRFPTAPTRIIGSR